MTRGRRRELSRLVVAPPTRWIGVEHEYAVTDRGSSPVDFRRLVDSVDAGVRHLDPGDPLAHRLPSGVLLTADGDEAEVATPPVGLGPGFTSTLRRSVDAAWSDLEAAVPAGHGLEGYSTHINVATPDRTVVRTARRFVDSHAIAMMLLMDRAHSPGLLVRPRRGRLELCGEHLDGEPLEAAAVFAAASTVALGRCAAPRVLRVAPAFEPARGRFGYYIDRRALGPDLYAHGRATTLGRATAGDYLATCWAWTRPFATTVASAGEIALVDDIVGGRRAIPLEEPPHPKPRQVTEESNAFGRVLKPCRRPAFVVHAKLVTWASVVLEVRGLDDRVLFLGVPGLQLETCLDQLASGALDEVLSDLLRRTDRLPVLVSSDQTGEVGAYRATGNLADLVPGERDPITGQVGGPGAPGSRQQKNQSQHQPRHVPKPPKATFLSGTAAIVGAAVVAALVVGGVATAAVKATHGHDDKTAANATPSTSSGPTTPTTTPTTTAPTTSKAPTTAPPNKPAGVATEPLVANYCSVLDPAKEKAITGFAIYPGSKPTKYECSWNLFVPKDNGLINVDLSQFSTFASLDEAVAFVDGLSPCHKAGDQTYRCGDEGYVFQQGRGVYWFTSTSKQFLEPLLEGVIRPALP